MPINTGSIRLNIQYLDVGAKFGLVSSAVNGKKKIKLLGIHDVIKMMSWECYLESVEIKKKIFFDVNIFSIVLSVL